MIVLLHLQQATIGATLHAATGVSAMKELQSLKRSLSVWKFAQAVEGSQLSTENWALMLTALITAVVD